MQFSVSFGACTTNSKRNSGGAGQQQVEMGWNMCKHVTHLVHQLATTTTTTTEAATTATTRTLVARRVTPPPPPTGRAGLPKESVNNIFHKFNWQQAGLAGWLEGRWGDDRSPGRIKGAAGEGGVGRGEGGTTTIERTRAITINDRYLPQQESTGKGEGEGRGSRQGIPWANDAEKVS